MRWMKHLCLAHQDGQLELFLEECGLEGYGFWWLLLEHIGAPLEPGSDQCWQSHSEVKWAQTLHTSTRKFRKFCHSLAVRNLIRCENFDDSSVNYSKFDNSLAVGTPKLLQNSEKTSLKRLRIVVPNLLKYRDEYSKNSAVSSENSRRSLGTRTEQSRINIEQIQKNTCAPSGAPAFELAPAEDPSGRKPKPAKNQDHPGFQAFWDLRWRSDDRQGASRAFRKAVGLYPVSVVMAGLQSARMAMLEREPQFRPLMSTWLNKCRFLDTPETPELLTVPKMAIASRFESREERLRREAQEAFDKNWDAEDKTA